MNRNPIDIVADSVLKQRVADDDAMNVTEVYKLFTVVVTVTKTNYDNNGKEASPELHVLTLENMFVHYLGNFHWCIGLHNRNAH